MEPIKVGFEVDESHLPLWERSAWRYAFLMGGRGNGRSGTASRYVTSRLLGKEYTRGSTMRAVKEDIVAIYWYNGGFLLHEILYQTELLNSHLISTFKALPKAPIIADSAEPKSIAELQAAGLNVIPCEKGADSVNFGIKHVQGLPISYTSSSTNMHDELSCTRFC